MLYSIITSKKTIKEKNMKTKHNWNSVNWLDQDIVIAKALGCSKQAVWEKLRKLGKPKSPNHCKHNIAVINKLLQTETENKTLSELSILVNYNVSTIRHILDENNKGYIFNDRRKICKYDWNKADWTKTDKEVALTLGIPNRAVVTSHRHRFGIKKNSVAVKSQKEINVPNYTKAQHIKYPGIK